jgi:hypothetical protein
MGVNRNFARETGLAKWGTIVSISTLSWILCLMLGVLVVVAVIAIARAYLNRRRPPFSLNGHW